jgi:RsiW-degrading membrane proteinase PrsW (M82 family)
MVFLCHNNASSVHVCLVANSYLLLLYFLVSQTMTEDCGKCVVTHIYAAWNSLCCKLHAVFCFMLRNMCMTKQIILLISTAIFLCSCYVWKAIFKKQHRQTEFINLVSYFYKNSYFGI